MLIRADVLDLLTEIHALIEETAPLARAFQPARPGLVPLRDRLLLVASVLPQLAQLNPEIYEAVSLKVWDLGQRVSDAVGEYDAPAPVAEECPRCGRTSLWISPVRGLVACIEDGCRASVWPADTPLE
jgi:hypothetical protein